MNPRSAIRKRFQTKTAKRIKGKVLAGVELVGPGAALTGGAMLLEEATKPKVAPGHDNVYATDNGATLFKYKTLASEEEGILTSEIIGYAILAICMVLFSIMFARAILKIKQMCGHKTNIFKIDKTMTTQTRISYTKRKHTGIKNLRSHQWKELSRTSTIQVSSTQLVTKL